MAGKGQKRKDKDRIVLKTGESQRPNGTYDYRWTGRDGKRHVVYAKTLEELREKEAQVANDTFEGIKAEARNVTINEMFDLWCQIKRGLKNNTFENYKYMYNLFVRPNFGKRRISTLKKSDVKQFYNQLADDRDHAGIPHGGFVMRSGVTGEHGETKQMIEYSLKLGSNPEFTSSVIVSFARAAYRMSKEGGCGARTVFDVPLAYLSPLSGEQLRKEML